MDISSYLSNDDIEIFLRLYVLLFADDTIILAESPKDLQAALDAAYEYCNDWKLQVNTTKTKVVIIPKVKVRKFPDFKFGTDSLEVVYDYVNLGTTINYNGPFNKAIDKQVNQAPRALFALNSRGKRLLQPLDVHLNFFL